MGIQMKKILLAGVAGIALVAGAPAHAADLRARRPPPPPPPPVVAPVPVFSWTGCYIGANIGGAWAHKDFSVNGFDDGSHSASGIAGGGQIGCDYQFASNWLIGIQGMFDGADLTGDHSFGDETFHTKVRWFGTVTGRLGFLVTPSFLIYGKGGVAFVGDHHSFTEDSSFASTGDFTRTGRCEILRQLIARGSPGESIILLGRLPGERQVRSLSSLAALRHRISA